MNNLKPRQLDFIKALKSGGYKSPVSRQELASVCESTGLYACPPSWITQDSGRIIERGLYEVPELDSVSTPKETVATPAPAPAPVAPVQGAVAVAPQMHTASLIMGMTGGERENLVPTKFSGYVTWGHFKDAEAVVKSRQFYPIFVTGLSGNGKTLMVKEVCAKLKREFIRANITVETDEDDLIGGFRLLNGETVWHDGPVVTAMKRGAVLLLDEIDLASNKIMALQPVLEGSSIYLKKIGKWVHPAEGFTVIATANTKGQGSDDGRFIGTNVLNEAFLERFPVTIEQSYPTAKMETKILDNELGKHGIEDAEFSTNLVKWADVIRKTFYEGGVDEIISTRRLVHIVGAFSIFKDKSKAIELTVNRFDIETKESFLDLYSKIDGGVDPDTLTGNQDNEDNEADDDIIDPPF